MAGTNASGAKTYINRYDEYGKPQSGNQGRFQYTGQVYLSDAKLYYYKARVYDPELGRFLQTDPIGYAAGMNLYAYVGNDPMNFNDPTGLDEFEWRRGRQMWEPMLLHGWHRDIPIAPPRQTYPIRRTNTDTTLQPSPIGREYNRAVAASAPQDVTDFAPAMAVFSAAARAEALTSLMISSRYWGPGTALGDLAATTGYAPSWYSEFRQSKTSGVLDVGFGTYNIFVVWETGRAYLAGVGGKTIYGIGAAAAFTVGYSLGRGIDNLSGGAISGALADAMIRADENLMEPLEYPPFSPFFWPTGP